MSCPEHPQLSLKPQRIFILQTEIFIPELRKKSQVHPHAFSACPNNTQSLPKCTCACHLYPDIFEG